MRRIWAAIWIAPLILILGLMISPAGHAAGTILYDNFQGSTINGAVWSWQPQNRVTGGQSQSACCPTLYDQSPSLQIGMLRYASYSTGTCTACYYWDGLIANNTASPQIPANNASGLVSLAVSARIENVTMNGVGLTNATSVCGLGGCIVDSFFGFLNHATCGGCVNTIPGGPVIALEMYSTTPNLFSSSPSVTYYADMDGNTTLGEKRFQIANGAVDPTQPHVFQISVNLAGANSWAAFMIDQMGVFNFTQQSCHCVTMTNPASMSVWLSYQGQTWNTMPWSVGETIAYVMVTDYIATPSQLPQGIYPGPNCNVNAPPGSPLNPNGVCTIGGVASTTPWDQAFQKFAVIAGGGNIYFGGMFIDALFTTTILLVTCIKFTTNRFVLTFTSLIPQVIFTMIAIIPLQVIIIVTAAIIAVIFGLIPATLGGGDRTELNDIPEGKR
jgi:hypothetical protein